MSTSSVTTSSDPTGSDFDGTAAPVPYEPESLTARFLRLKHRMAVRAGVPFSACYGSRGTGALGILMYHRVAPIVPGLSEPTYNVTPERFHEQLAGLLARGFLAWPLRMVLEAHRRGRSIPREVFVVTFDDGYESVYRHAWPVLQDLGIPATVFLTTGFLDSPRPFPFDNWRGKGAPHAEECWRPLSTQQCRAMHTSGLIEFGSHTHTHDDFRDRPEEFARDLETSLAVLRDRFAIRDATFAFPYGTRRTGFSGPKMAAVCRAMGMLCSLTTEEELVGAGDDPFDWGRFTAEADDTSATLAAKLDGWYDLLRGAWRTLSHPFERRTRRKTLTASSLPQRQR